MDNQYIVSIITISGTLLGILIGGLISFFIQSSSDKRKQQQENFTFMRNKKIDMFIDLLSTLHHGQLYPAIKLHEDGVEEITHDKLKLIVEKIHTYVTSNFYQYSLVCDDEIMKSMGYLNGYTTAIKRRLEQEEDLDRLAIVKTISGESNIMLSLMRKELGL